MTTTTAPISTRSIDGHPCVISTADRVRPALNGGQALTIEADGPLHGDTVWLKAYERYAPGQGYGYQPLAAEPIHHPQFGEVWIAWIDLGRLDDAPALRAILARTASHTAASEDREQAAEDRIIAEGDR